jgi:hypothetical protein
MKTICFEIALDPGGQPTAGEGSLSFVIKTATGSEHAR